MQPTLTRRAWLAQTSAAVGAGLALTPAAPAADRPKDEPFGYSFNTSTIMGQKVPIQKIVDLVGPAGYHTIEPWTRELDAFVQGGGDLKDLGKRIRDHGLTVESSIGFAEWIVDDESRRKKGLEQAKHDMDMVQKIGGKRMAAPPVGATKEGERVDLLKAAERYHALLEVGDQIGVVPQAEVWGFSKTMSLVGETALVAIESRHPRACMLLDVYHLYKGGSDFEGMRLLGGAGLQVFHINDYPASPPRAQITDAHRVYPGDGVAPLKTMLRDLYALGFRGTLSLELFNRDYWKQDPGLVVRTGLEKMRATVRAAFA